MLAPSTTAPRQTLKLNAWRFARMHAVRACNLQLDNGSMCEQWTENRQNRPKPHKNLSQMGQQGPGPSNEPKTGENWQKIAIFSPRCLKFLNNNWNVFHRSSPIQKYTCMNPAWWCSENCSLNSWKGAWTSSVINRWMDRKAGTGSLWDRISHFAPTWSSLSQMCF